MEFLKITVMYLVLSVLECSGMSVSELEEFSNFLKKTSQLDEILKKGTSPDEDFDEDEPASDHAWEESGKFEGDLILNDRQRRVLVADVAEGLARNGLSDSTKRWPDNEVIYYIQKEHFSNDQIDAIQNGIHDLAQASCVKFRPYRKGDRDAVVIQGSRRGCFSQVGYQGGYQVLNLSGRHPVGRGCFRHGTVVHELLHTLGFYHMQSSPDRDDYIDVKWENIIEPAKHNFRKYNTFSVSDFGVGYDYDSVLHYSRRAFSSNGQDTLVPKQSGASIGQRVGLSDKDAQKLNKMYCDADSDNHDAVEDSAQKPPTKKKKKPKNKPFEGHGIGYHQGKVVVIKLPAAKTIKMADTPTFHMFDHFSKAPEAVSPATPEGFGIGEEIIFPYAYKPYTFNREDYEKPSVSSHEDKSKSIEDSDYDFGHSNNEIPGKTEPVVKDASKLKSQKSTENLNEVIEKGNSTEINDDLNDAFERLGRIIKTHVYPSQTPDLEAYRNFDYSKYYNPERKHEPESEIIKVDKAFASNTTTSNLDKGQNKDSVNQTNKVLENKKQKMLTTEEDKETENEKDSFETYSSESPNSKTKTYKDYDASYGTSYPLNKLLKIKEEKYVTPEFASFEHLANRHDYSKLYKTGEEELPQSQKHSLFGYVPPLHGNINSKEDFENDNKKYDKESYVNSGEKAKQNTSSKLAHYESAKGKLKSIFGRVPSGKKAYSLFGVLVPLTHNWFKVNYDPHEKSFYIEDPESSEDYR